MKRNRQNEIKGNITGKKKRPGNTSLSKPLTPKQARHMAGADARAEYAPVIGAIKSESRASGQRQKQIPQWFGQVANQANQAAAQTDASYGQANAAMLANIEAAQKAAQANQAQVAGGNADFAALTGADPSAFAPTTQDSQNAAAQRSLTQAALAAPIATAGAAQSGFLRTTGVNARREGIHQRGLESKRQMKIKQDLLAARKERSQKAVGNFGVIRDAEANRALERWKVNKAFPLEQQQANSAVAGAARDDSFRDRELDIREREMKQGGGGESGLSPSERREKREGFKGATQAANNLIKANGIPKTAKEWAGLQALLEDKEEISPSEAAYAVKKMKKRYSDRIKASKQGNRGVKGSTEVPYAP